MILKQLIRPRWQIGIVENSLEGIVNGEELRVQWPANPFHDRWFADPFVLSVNGNEVTLLVEDYRYNDDRGRISRIIVDMDRNSIVSCKTILDGGHYSFPAILRKDNKIFVYPERGPKGRLEMFEYDVEDNVCKYVQTLSDDIFPDAIIHDGMVFSMNEQWNILVEKKIDKDLMQIIDTKSREYIFDECIARNAGDFFECGRKVFRPAQECNRWYGNALSIQLYENGEFKEVRRIPRMHTLNSYQGVTVVDRKIFPFQWVYRLLRRTDK